MSNEYNRALEDVHDIIADWYDEELERNRVNAMRNHSKTARILKERIDVIKQKEVKEK